MATHDVTDRSLSLKLIAIALSLVVLVATLFLARYVVLTALLGIGLGVLFVPAVNWMTRKLRVPRGIAGLILVFGIVLLLAGVSLAFGLLVSDQFVQLQNKAPQIYQSVQDMMENQLKRVPWLGTQLQRINAGTFFGNFSKWALGGIQTGLASWRDFSMSSRM